MVFMADSRHAPNQWEMSLQSNAVSHWLGANLKSAMVFINYLTGCWQMIHSQQVAIYFSADFRSNHYNDVIMGAIASQFTSLTIVYSTVYSDADQRKHQSSASLAFVRGIHRWPVNSPHKWPGTRKMFPFDDVIMNCHDADKANNNSNITVNICLLAESSNRQRCNESLINLLAYTFVIWWRHDREIILALMAFYEDSQLMTCVFHAQMTSNA